MGGGVTGILQSASRNQHIAAITQRIPKKNLQMTRHFGWYSKKTRGLRAKADILSNTDTDKSARAPPLRTGISGRRVSLTIMRNTWKRLSMSQSMTLPALLVIGTTGIVDLSKDTYVRFYGAVDPELFH